MAFADDRADWLHTLTADDLAALYAFRRYARQQYPEADNAMATAWDVWDVGGVVRSFDEGRVALLLAKMPRDFVVSLDRGV